ncbi:MAG: hypothetical protein GY842_03030, partial [bacterium]|nr:hypothetical protein [bacterium]
VNDEYEVFGQRVNAATGAEVGPNDFRLSDMGPDGDTNYKAMDPVVVYNSTDNDYMVVWRGDDDTDELVDNEYEIFGQRVDAATGAEIGDDLRFSDMGPDGDTEYGATDPAMAYNSTNNEYLLVWEGDDDIAPLVENESEIFGQRVNAASGAEVGANDFRLSNLGPDGDPDYDASYPAVAYDSTDNEYLVVWEGDDDTVPLVENEWEIFGQRVDAATGDEIGGDLRLSDMGPNGDSDYYAGDAVVAYGSTAGEYLVVWWGDDDTAPLLKYKYAIFGQRVDAASGVEVGSNDVRLSDMGADLDYDAHEPAVAYNNTNDEYLVVWAGDDNTGGLVDDEFEIYGQRVDASTGKEIGVNIRFSDMGPDGDADYDAHSPAVAYNSTGNEYLVVWAGHDRHPSLLISEYDIYAQRVDAVSGFEIGDDFRLSNMGPDWNTNYRAKEPAVVYNSTANEYLVVWSGDDDTTPLVDNEYEIFGQRVNAETGATVGENDFRLSDMGPDGNVNYGAYEPQAVYNSINGEYLVVWSGDDSTSEESEIYGQRVNASTGVEVGSNDFRLSDMGPDGDNNYSAFSPAVAYNSTDGEYLVVWSGDDNSAPLVEGEYEVFAQRINAASGAEVGTNDFRLSDMGPDGDPGYDTALLAVSYNSTDNEYLVVWQGD